MAASAINNNGWIVGVGNNPDGINDAFLLTPVPEPPAGVLALWSLAAIWIVGSRIGLCTPPRVWGDGCQARCERFAVRSFGN